MARDGGRTMAKGPSMPAQRCENGLGDGQEERNGQAEE